MKNLYYCQASQWERNQVARCVLTADSEDEARGVIFEWLGDRWRVPKVVLICRVEAPVELMEL